MVMGALQIHPSLLFSMDGKINRWSVKGSGKITDLEYAPKVLHATSLVHFQKMHKNTQTNICQWETTKNAE